MPCEISRPVLQPMIPTCMAWKGGTVAVTEAVSVTGGVNVKVGGTSAGVVGVIGVMGTTPGVGEAVMVGIKMMGVGLRIPGVRDGIAVQTGNGWGATFQSPQAVSRKVIRRKLEIFFMAASFFNIVSCLRKIARPTLQIPCNLGLLRLRY